MVQYYERDAMNKSYEKLGLMYLGREVERTTSEPGAVPFLIRNKDLTTHGAILGMTGSGKTGLGVALIEEAIMDSIPTLIIDPKGDMANLLLSFPGNRPEDFTPWVDSAEAERKGMTPEQYGEHLARQWKEGLADWDQGLERIAQMRQKSQMVIHTPGSSAGMPLSVLSSFQAPDPAVLADLDSLNSLVASTAAGLLALVDVEGDPMQSREHILLCSLLLHFWRKGEDLTMEPLIGGLVAPPFDKVGVFPLNTWYPQAERMQFAMKLNNLLASPSFANWMTGLPMDIDQLLYTESGLPKTCIFSIAHLSDGERMFFVTMLLSRFIDWMRRQPGSSSLKTLLYMDEIFGFFPPVANPPSKKPMLLLLKQARAFGVGVVLATQNPADLDYKGLSNIGSWFIGRLQTARDRSKVLDGIGSRIADGDSLLSSMKSRQFLLTSVHEPEPKLFQTRWVMSFLKGPVSLNGIKKLMGNMVPVASEAPIPAVATAVAASAPDTVRRARPMLGAGIEQFYLLHDLVKDQVTLMPHLVGECSVRFYNKKRNIDQVGPEALILSLDSGFQRAQWDKAADFASSLDYCTKTSPESCSFGELPSAISAMKNLRSFEKALSDYLYQNRELVLYRLVDSSFESDPGESKAAFRGRCIHHLRETREEAVDKIRRRFLPRQRRLERKLEKTMARLEKEQADVRSKTTDSIISVGVAVLGAFFGRKKISSGTVGRAATAIRGVGRVGREKDDVRRMEDEVEAVRQEIEELTEEIELLVDEENSRWNPEKLEIESFAIKPRRSDIFDVRVALVWEMVC